MAPLPSIVTKGGFVYRWFWFKDWLERSLSITPSVGTFQRKPAKCHRDTADGQDAPEGAVHTLSTPYTLGGALLGAAVNTEEQLRGRPLEAQPAGRGCGPERGAQDWSGGLLCTRPHREAATAPMGTSLGARCHGAMGLMCSLGGEVRSGAPAVWAEQRGSSGGPPLPHCPCWPPTWDTAGLARRSPGACPVLRPHTAEMVPCFL